MLHHLVDHHRTHQLSSDSTLHVIAVVSNVAQYQSRYRLFHEFRERMHSTANVKLHTVECAFGDRSFQVGADWNVRTDQSIWTKESLVNIAEANLLPNDYKYLAWIDADVEFRSPTWALDTIHRLQHYAVVQPFQQAEDLTHSGTISTLFSSFGHLQQKGCKLQNKRGGEYSFGHPGFAWACRRDFFEAVGGLIDWGILGSADTYMAWAMIGKPEEAIRSELHPSHLKLTRAWSKKALRLTHGQVGCTPGRLEHHFHGPKARRYYRERWEILRDHDFDPENDVCHDAQGLVRLINKPHLNHAIHKYHFSRCEDSIEDK